MYAVFNACGRQFKAEKGDVIYLEKLNAKEDDIVTFDDVALVGTDDGVKVGTPALSGAKVSAKVLKNGKSKKIKVFTYKPKKNEKRLQGHRQAYTKVEITDITL